MSDNHDLLNDNNMCSFEEHEAENVCFNKDAVAGRQDMVDRSGILQSRRCISVCGWSVCSRIFI